MVNFQHVQSGDPLVISATEYNAMLDAGKAARNRPINHGTHGNGLDSLYVFIANATGRRLQKFDVVGLDEALHKADLNEFCHRPAFKGVVPNKEKHAGRFGILQADCEPRQLVRVCVSGITIARIRAQEESNGKEIFSCDITDGETQFLSQGGHQEVLWSDSVSITPGDDHETITAAVPYPDDLKECPAGHPCRYYADGDGWTLLDLACPKEE